MNPILAVGMIFAGVVATVLGAILIDLAKQKMGLRRSD